MFYLPKDISTPCVKTWQLNNSHLSTTLFICGISSENRKHLSPLVLTLWGKSVNVCCSQSIYISQNHIYIRHKTRLRSSIWTPHYSKLVCTPSGPSLNRTTFNNPEITAASRPSSLHVLLVVNLIIVLCGMLFIFSVFLNCYPQKAAFSLDFSILVNTSHKHIGEHMIHI